MLSEDVFEKFIATCSQFYGLDPRHYFRSPALSWDAMLKMICVKLEKISDARLILGLSVGSSYIAKRLAKTNNKYMNDYDPKKPSYLDMNNLYGCAMSEYLPYEGFEWLKNVDELDVMSISECNSIEKKSNRVFSRSWP